MEIENKMADIPTWSIDTLHTQRVPHKILRKLSTLVDIA